ncbi:hypothetical protein D1839_14555 [Roseburia sp. 1XD42-34]|nr:hypothetical protein [Roseburia sp. 1XD42-34]RKI75905.1 hypothetical protein D7V87_14635 [Clostridium sp. 1xD42-85]
MLLLAKDSPMNKQYRLTFQPWDLLTAYFIQKHTKKIKWNFQSAEVFFHPQLIVSTVIVRPKGFLQNSTFRCRYLQLL